MMFRKLNLLVSFIILFCLSITLSHAGKFPAGYPECWQDTKNPIILNIESPNQFCPLNSKLGHKFFLVDFTSPLKQPQIDWISGRIFGNALIKETPPYHKISYMKIDNTAPQSQEISYSKCRFKTGNKSKFNGEETNTGCEGQKQIGEVYTAWNTLTNKFENEFLVNTFKGDQELSGSENQTNPKVTKLNDGSFVVIWESPMQEYTQQEILNNPNILKVGTQTQFKGLYGQKFTSEGVKIGGEFQVNSIRDGNQHNHEIIALSHGGFAVVWENGIGKK